VKSLFKNLLSKRKTLSTVLVIGSGTIGSGMSTLYGNANLNIVGIDIYSSPSVDYIADSHYLPFKNQVFDGIWVQAVLEHVVDPSLVISEIYRILKNDGIVYAETPFMQQVHEGAHDFQRYTILGHRFLFRDFDVIKIGGNGGSGVALAWSLRYFFWSILRSKYLAIILSAPFYLFLRFLDRFASKNSLYDSASGVYFLGKKNGSSKLRHIDLKLLYQGLQK
jgi:SAM-dependent methyltransferase